MGTVFPRAVSGVPVILGGGGGGGGGGGERGEVVVDVGVVKHFVDLRDVKGGGRFVSRGGALV